MFARGYRFVQVLLCVLLVAFSTGCAARISKAQLVIEEKKLCHPWIQFMEPYRKPPIKVPFERGTEIEFHYAELGVLNGVAYPDKPVFVFLHGTTGSQSLWAPLLRDSLSLANDWRVIVVDRLGHGRTNIKGPAEGVRCVLGSFDVEVRALNAFLKRLPLPPKNIILVGHSFGGVVAWKFARCHSEMVSGLVLIDALGFPRPKSEQTKVDRSIQKNSRLLASNPDLAFLGAGRKATFDTLIEMGYDRESAERAVDIYYLSTIAGSNMEAAVSLTLEELNFDLYETQDQLSGIECKTLLIWGENDRVSTVARQACGFACALGWLQPVFYVMKNGGHAPHEKFPNQVNMLIRNWCGVRGAMPDRSGFVAGECQVTQSDGWYIKKTRVIKD